jgi:hypothetical protein
MSLVQSELAPAEVKVASRSNELVPLAIMAAAALMFVLPGILYGFPTGHDTFLHATAWFDTLTHWSEGDFFPAWASRFAFGWGLPVHVFYPPLSFAFGALCLLLVGPYFAPILFCWTVLTFAGYAAYRFCKLLRLDETSAIVAGVTYLLSPYFGLNLYERNAFPEVMAAAIFPVVLHAYIRMQRDRTSPLYLALALAVMLLTNIPATAITVAVLALLTIVDSICKRNFAHLGRAVLAGSIALLLSAFYLVPVIAQKNMIHLRLVATGGQDPVNNFELLAGRSLFIHDFFSYLALISTILTLLLIAAIATTWKSNSTSSYTSFAAVAAFSIFMMLPITRTIYAHLPGMKYINFPWRFLFVVSFLIALFVAQALHQGDRRRWLVLATLCGFAISWYAMWPPTWLHNEDATWGKYSAARTAALPGVQEMMPITARFSEEGDYGPPQVVAIDSGAPCRTLQLERWHSEHRIIHFDCGDTTLVLKTFFYPGWKILANGRPAPVAFNEQGAFLVQVQGAGTLDMQFIWTKDRKLGAMVSLLTLLICLAFLVLENHRDNISPQTKRAEP